MKYLVNVTIQVLKSWSNVKHEQNSLWEMGMFAFTQNLAFCLGFLVLLDQVNDQDICSPGFFFFL